MPLFQILLPEIFLVVTACVLFLLGFAIRGPRAGRAAAIVALIGVGFAFLFALLQYRNPDLVDLAVSDAYAGVRLTGFGMFVRVASLLVGIVLVLLNWPTEPDGSGNASVNWGRDAGEFFGLLLLSLTGLILVASANDLILLFLAIELASIPTYVLVSVSRPLAQSQEAGVKYFFLGAMAAAILLMGFGYLYGVTGTTNLHEIAGQFAALRPAAGGAPVLGGWQLLAGVMLVLGLAFKLAAVPLHAYAGDVYQGAATSITAVIGFVPKTVGVVTLVKIAHVYAGGSMTLDVAPQFAKLLWVVAILTMTVGNLLALLQQNVKRTLAYSSVAHSGYLIAGVSLAVMLPGGELRAAAMAAVLFYLVVYGITSTAAFGALQLIPTRQTIAARAGEFLAPSTTAETYDDLAGAGRHAPLGAWALAIACFSLLGLPLTGGFNAKLYLLMPALGNVGGTAGGPMAPWALWLAIAILVNSAISAAYYLGIVATLFARADAGPVGRGPLPARRGVAVGVVACAAIVLLIGLLPGLAGRLSDRARYAVTQLSPANEVGATAVAVDRVASR